MSVIVSVPAETLEGRSIANRKRLRRLIEFVAGPALLIAVWWIAYAGTLVDARLLPSPFATLADTGRNIITGAMTRDFLQTGLRVFYAFGIAAVLGVPVGIILGGARASTARSSSSSTSSARRPPPPCSRCSCCCSGSATFPRSRSRPSRPGW